MTDQITAIHSATKNLKDAIMRMSKAVYEVNEQKPWEHSYWRKEVLADPEVKTLMNFAAAQRGLDLPTAEMLVKWDREENGVAATMNLDKARALLEFLNTYAKDEAVTLEAQNAGKDLKVAAATYREAMQQSGLPADKNLLSFVPPGA